LGNEFDGSLDIFALGATLYEAALGIPAFGGDEQVALRKIVSGELADPRQVRPDFPAPFWKVLQQAMALRPDDRLRPAAQLARALDGVAGLTPAQGRALLSSAMSRLFPDEMGAESSDIAELRRLSRTPEEPTGQGHVVSRVTHERPRPRLSSAAWILGLLAVGGGAVALLRQPAASVVVPAPRAAAAPPEAGPSVEIGVQVSPLGVSGLELSIGGVPVPAQAPHRLVPRASGPLAVRVSAPGYRSVELPVTPDRDRTLMVTLAPSPPLVGPSDAELAKPTRATGAAPAAPSGVIRRYPF
jgi:hypothetical protein